MLIRSRSHPSDLYQLSHQSTFLSDRNVQKLARQSDHHGCYVSSKLRRFEASGCRDQQLSRDKQSSSCPPAHHPLTKPTTASLTRPGRRDFVASKDSQNQSLQVALVPETLILKEGLYKGLHLSSTSQESNLQPQGASQVLRKQVVGERKDGPESTNCGVQEIQRFSAAELFIRQEGKADPLSASSADPVDLGHSQLASMERTKSTTEGTTLRNIWKKKKEKRRMGSLLLLNVLAALYGSSNVANGIVADTAPSLPVSLTSLVRVTSALVFFTPALATALKNRDLEQLRGGVELGGLAFAATVIDSCNPSSGSSSSAALLFAFTVIFVPVMEIFAGRRSGSTLARFAILAAISGMGLLEEEGFGWRGISCPQIGDLWSMAMSIVSAVHIFRSEYHSGRSDPLLLNAVQCGVLAILSLGWETFSTFGTTALQGHDVVLQIQSLPWAPLIYNGLVCFGLCSWLELHGLRSIHASTATLVYTTIPVWGAFLSFFANHEAPAESALIGGLVIMGTSIYAQMTTTSADIKLFGHDQTKGSARTSSHPKPDVEDARSKLSRSDCGASAKDTHQSTRDQRTHDYFPGALLTSQLKFPYYAAQAKRLLADVKIKLGALKSVLLTSVSSNITSTSSSGPAGVKPAPGEVSSAAGAPPASFHEANSLPGTSTTITSVTSHVANTDLAVAQHVFRPHIDIVGPVSPPGSGIVSEALRTTHSSDVAALVFNVGTHILAAVTTGLESALVAVGSDIMVGYEEAEDAATLVERLIQLAADNGAHTVAACLSGGASWLDSTSSNFVDLAAHILKSLP